MLEMMVALGSGEEQRRADEAICSAVFLLGRIGCHRDYGLWVVVLFTNLSVANSQSSCQGA